MVRKKGTPDKTAPEPGPAGRVFDHIEDRLGQAPDLDTVHRILSIEVDLRPGGRALLRSPDGGFRVEVLWHQDAKRFVMEEVRIVAEDWGLEEGALAEIIRGRLQGPLRERYVDLDHYFIALELTLWGDSRDFIRRVPRRRPKPGQALDLDFYRHVLAVHKELIAAGHPAPAAELAERMGENPATVRGWIHRAREHEKKRRKS